MSNTVIIYTDGSAHNKTHDKGGYGIVLKYKQHEKRYHFGSYYNTTSARQELRGAIHALRLVTNKAFKVKLHCDNMYVVKSVAADWLLTWEAQGWCNRVNKDLLQELLTEVRRFPAGYVQFIHVKGHSDNEYNEVCDKLAKAGGRLANRVNDDAPLRTQSG